MCLLRLCLLWLCLLWLCLLRLPFLGLSLLRLPRLRLSFLRLPLLRLSFLSLSFLRLSFLRLSLLRLSRLRLSFLWLSLFRRVCLGLCAAVFGELLNLFIQLFKPLIECLGFLGEGLTFEVLFIELLLFRGIVFGGRIWCGLLGSGELPGSLFELPGCVSDIFLWDCQVTLLEFPDGFIEGLYCWPWDISGLLFEFAAELFCFVASLLELIGDFLGIACGIASFFVDTFGEVLLSSGEVLKLPCGGCGAIKLSFSGGLQEFLFALQELIEIVADILLFLLQALTLLFQLLLEIHWVLPGFGASLPLLLELVGVGCELFGVECDAVEVCEFLFELCGALNFFDGAVEFIATAVEFMRGLLQIFCSGIAFGRSGSIEQLGDFLTDILSQFCEFGGLLLHERMLAGLFGELLELVALSLFLFAESPGFLARLIIPVASGLIAQLSGSGGVFAELFGHGFEIVNQLLVCLLECLSAEGFSVVADANGPGTFPHHLRPRNLSLICRANAEFNGVVLFDTEALQVEAKIMGNLKCAVVERRCGDDAGGVLVPANVQFKQSDSDIIRNNAIQGNHIIRTDFECICESLDFKHRRGIRGGDQTPAGFVFVLQTIFVCGHKAKTAAAKCWEFDHSGEAIRGEYDLGNHRGGGVPGGCSIDWSTSHGGVGRSSSNFLGERRGAIFDSWCSSGLASVRSGNRTLFRREYRCGKQGFPIEPFQLQLLHGLAEAKLNFDFTAFKDGDVSNGPIDDLDGAIGPCGWCFFERCGKNLRRISDDQLIPCRGSTVAGHSISERLAGLCKHGCEGRAGFIPKHGQLFNVAIVGLHLQNHGFRASPGLLSSPKWPGGKCHIGSCGRHMIARCDFEVEVGRCGQICEWHQQPLEQQPGSIRPEQHRDQPEQKQSGGSACATNDGLNIDHLIRPNGLHLLRNLLPEPLLHDFRTGIGEQLWGAVNRDQRGECLLQVRESQVHGSAELFRGQASNERSQQPQPRCSKSADNDTCKEPKADGTGQYNQQVEQTGQQQANQQKTDRFSATADRCVQSHPPLTLIQKTLKTRDLSQNSGGHAGLLLETDCCAAVTTCTNHPDSLQTEL